MKKTLFISLIFFIKTIGAYSQSFDWARGFGDNGYDRASSVIADANGNIYTVGSFSGTVDFDPGVGTNNITSLGAMDFFVAKFDSAGNFIWAKQLGGANAEIDFEISIAIDVFNNVYITGGFSGTMDFDPGTGVYNLTSPGSTPNNVVPDVFLTKLDSNGNFIWAVRFGSTEYDAGMGVVTAMNGDVYLTGDFGGTVDFDPGVGTFNLTSGSTLTDTYIAKLDSAGNFLWVKQLGGGSSSDTEGFSIILDNSGYVYTTGGFGGTVDFDPGPGVYNLTATSNVFISKLDAAGNFIWAKQFGSVIDSDFYSTVIDNTTQSLYTIGNFRGTRDFDPGTGVVNMTSVGWSDAFVHKLDTAGNFGWAKQFADTYGCSIALDGQGNIYASGGFSGTKDFDPGSGVFNLLSSGSDAFIVELNNSGNFVVATHYGGSPGAVALSITLDAEENIITSGFFYGTTDFDPGVAIYNLAAPNGTNDAFIHKMSNLQSVSVNEASINSEINVYPNPTTGQLTIKSINSEAIRKISVKNILGEIIFSEQGNYNGLWSIDLTGAPGIYFVEVQTITGAVAVTKVLKQ